MSSKCGSDSLDIFNFYKIFYVSTKYFYVSSINISVTLPHEARRSHPSLRLVTTHDTVVETWTCTNVDAGTRNKFGVQCVECMQDSSSYRQHIKTVSPQLSFRNTWAGRGEGWPTSAGPGEEQ